MDSERFSNPIQDDYNAPAWKRMWNRLTPKWKKGAVAGLALLVFAAICVFGNDSREEEKKKIEKEKASTAKITDIKMDDSLLEKSLYVATQDLVNKQKDQISTMRAEIEALRNVPPKVIVQSTPAQTQPTIADVKKEVKTGPATVALPPPPKIDTASRNQLFSQPPPPPTQNEPVIRKELVGGIEVVQQAMEEPEVKDDGKKKAVSIYLPPSFMEANTLSGMAAPTTNTGKNNPLPILLRIKTPAFLPNQVKTNLKGCYAIGEGIGDLASERVHIRLKTLSCVAKDGAAVIDQEVHGFVTDGDGRVGMRGKVVAKMGMHVARTALAGFIEGIGDAVATSTTTQSLTEFGTPTAVFEDTSLGNIATAGMGKGISNAAESLKNFYLQLSEQTLPVIEVGSQKNVTVVISEGTSLQIKDTTIG